METKKVRNFILATFLKNFKKIEPYYFWTNDKFYPQFEPELKQILDDENTLVIIAFDKPDNVPDNPLHILLTPYNGPFNLETSCKVLGWIIAGKDPNNNAVFIPYMLVSISRKGD